VSGLRTSSAAPSQPGAIPGTPLPSALPRRITLALLGNPNTGKTSLFNHLCGLSAKTANFPGTTSSVRRGRCTLEHHGEEVEVLDLPGLYSLNLNLPEAQVCRETLSGQRPGGAPDIVAVVVDAANLPRNLLLVGEILACRLPTVIALNMLDVAARRGAEVDIGVLSRELACPVVPIMARRGDGLPELRGAVEELLGASVPPPARAVPAGFLDEDPEVASMAREEWAEAVAERSVRETAAGPEEEGWTERLDHLFTHPVGGLIVFTVVMMALFWTIFKFAEVPMDLIEGTFAVLGGAVEKVVPAGALQDFLVDGVVGGVSGTVVFVPQICLLFFLISLLEDTGYLARAAFVMDGLLRRFGLPGHAFVPLLSSHACALPGILSARLIPDRRDRLATILVAPFMSCSARLPVYVLLTGLLFADRPVLAGVAFAGCYVLGAGVALLSAALFRRTLLRGPSRPMVLELPSYKWPSLRTALIQAKDEGLSFLQKAGTVILGICMVMWWLSAYPQVEPPAEAMTLRAEAARLAATAPEQSASLSAEADRLEQAHERAHSFAGRLGRAAQPIFAPLGYDWQLTVGVLTSFAAREVFVSTMAVLLSGEEESDVGALAATGVLAEIRAARREDGTIVFTAATSASLLVFFVLAMQCLPTLVLTMRETGSWRWAALQFAYMSGLAYVMAFLTRHGLGWLGIS